MIQLTIFDIEMPKKKELRLKTMRTDTLENIVKDLGFGGLRTEENGYYVKAGNYKVSENLVFALGASIEKTIVISHYREGSDNTLIEFDQDGTAYYRVLHVTCSDIQVAKCATAKFSISDTKQLKRLPTGRITLVQDVKEIEEILAKKSGYTARYYQEKKQDGCTAALLLIAPQIEQLDQAGYAFAELMFGWGKVQSGVYYRDDMKSSVECFNRLTQPGTSPKTIFKTSKAVFTALKEERDLSYWDSFRKMDKFGRIRNDEVAMLYNGGYHQKEIEQISGILAKQYNGKPVFNLRSLLQYLDRIDMFEAISRQEGLMLLNDYLSMCSQLEIQPRIDGDSLKREHDIVARNCRNKRNEIMAKKMEPAVDNLKVYNYEEDIFMIRGIESYDDLLDEANQQHNCVASYAERIVSGRSRIYVMRMKNASNRSLITVELSPDGKEIRQKFLAYNRPIHNKAQTDFLNRWLAFCRNGGNAKKTEAVTAVA